MKRYRLIALLVMAALLIAPTGCAQEKQTEEQQGLTVNGTAVALPLTITQGGEYQLSGTAQGQITVDAEHANVDLIFDGLDLSCESSAPVYIKNADAVNVTLAEGSENRLSTRSDFAAIDDNNIDGVIFAKDDLTLGGTGALTVDSSAHGIVCKDVLKITDGNYTVTAASHAISGKDGVEITGGTFSLTAGTDGVHSDTDLTVDGGNFSIASEDDGIHADGALTVNDGHIDITESCEGLEGMSVLLAGGEISIVSSDDGINASGDAAQSGGNRGGMFGALEGCSITLSGATVTVNASGDGIDSNGDVIMSGGTVLVFGSTNSADSALDYDGQAQITGGTFVALGAVGMAQNFGQDSTQCSLLTNFSGDAGKELTITDAAGAVLFTCTPEKRYECVLISCPDMTADGTYTLRAGEQSTSVTMTGTVTGSSGMGGMHGDMGGGFGGMHGGMSRPQDDRTDFPGGKQPMQPDEQQDGEPPARPDDLPEGDLSMRPGEQPQGSRPVEKKVM